MSTAITFPTSILDRLSRLHLATDRDSRNPPLAHIACRITADQVRFSATNGRILVALVVAQGDAPSGTPVTEPIEIVLDREQLVSATKALVKNAGRISQVVMTVERHEVRLTCGLSSALVRMPEFTFPATDHVWTKPAGMRWIPCVASLDPNLLVIAQRMSGTTSLLFCSPVPDGSTAPRLWASTSASFDETITLSDLQTTVRSPAYWCDHELAILIMPVTRAVDERQLDLSSFSMQPTAAVAAA